MFVQTLSSWAAVRRADSSSPRGESRSGSPGSTMGSGWRRARNALGLNYCASAQHEPDDDVPQEVNSPRTGASADESKSQTPGSVSAPASPTAGRSSSSSRLSLIRTSIRLPRSTCAICLESMKAGQGALFTAECSHTFHFSCIASNVRHGNLVCPVCRAKWNEVPWQAPADHLPSSDEQSPRPASGFRTWRSHRVFTSGQSSGNDSEDVVEGEGTDEERRLDPVLRILDESIANARGIRRTGTREPRVFDDDEPLTTPASTPTSADREHTGREGTSADGTQEEDGASRTETSRAGAENASRHGSSQVDISCFVELGAVAAAQERDPFTVLVHLKSSGPSRAAEEGREVLEDQLLDPSCRAPLDLVTVIDISGSMAGTKLILLKRAMEFVISNLSPSDRLSVVAFSSAARRLFPLRRMGEDGRHLALRCVESLVSNGGTNIADGLRKGAKVLEDRRVRNPVASIMLLSDGQDTFNMGNRPQFTPNSSDLRRLLPESMRHTLRYGQPSPIPVHTFGFGADHDSATLHSISEVSGGTFSFIQAEAAVQDAFAQCIGGLLSVVVQDAQVTISSAAPFVQMKALQAGSYESSLTANGTVGVVKLGDLYAEEERDILVDLKIPPCVSESGSPSHLVTPLLRVSCSYRDPITRNVCETPTTNVQIARPEFVDATTQSVSLEVDRQRNRTRVAQIIVEAGTLADEGDIAGAQEILSGAKESLHNSPAFQTGDNLCVGLDVELAEIQTRMANYQMYERTGRAYVLSAQSSHFRQRATTRGDDSHSGEYRTPSMTSMIVRSQTVNDSSLDESPRSSTRESRRSSLQPPISIPSRSASRMLQRRNSGI